MDANNVDHLQPIHFGIIIKSPHHGHILRVTSGEITQETTTIVDITLKCIPQVHKQIQGWIKLFQRGY